MSKLSEQSVAATGDETGPDSPEVALAGALYPSRQRELGVLRAFAEEVRANGWRVGGIVQEILKDEDDLTIGIDAIELDTGHRFAINRPTDSDRINKTCSLDPAVLAEASGALDRAIRSHMDLVIVEKFGEQEQQGGGLADEILRSVSEGIPTLVAVPDGVREVWREFTGEMGEELSFEMDAFRAWWRRHQPEPRAIPHAD